MADAACAADAYNGGQIACRWCEPCHVVAADQRGATGEAPPFCLPSFAACLPCDGCTRRMCSCERRLKPAKSALEHDLEKWKPVFGKDHASTSS